MKKYLPVVFLIFTLFAGEISLGEGGSIHFAFPGLSRRHFGIRIANPVAIPTKNYIYPRVPVAPFKQWVANDGYCGEVSLIQAGMNNGQWMSQYNARLICGTGLSQTGPDGFCTATHNVPNYNSQVLLENPKAGDLVFASAEHCLKNARLAFNTYKYAHQDHGIEGFKHYLSWVKEQVIAGHQVTVGVMDHGDHDPQYDHEVSVTKIGTNHETDDSRFYDDDVLYFDDHSSSRNSYDVGYTFKSLGKTREEANADTQEYSILIPGVFPTYTSAGGDGVNVNPQPIVGADYGFSVSGPADEKKETLPVVLTILSSSSNGSVSVPDPFDNFNFEAPDMGDEKACTNLPPKNWMELTLGVNVSRLKPGTEYNLYEYDFDGIWGMGSDAGLSVPSSDFNKLSYLATKTTRFVATESTYSQIVQTTSDKVVVFRCVKANAP